MCETTASRPFVLHLFIYHFPKEKYHFSKSKYTQYSHTIERKNLLITHSLIIHSLNNSTIELFLSKKMNIFLLKIGICQ